MLNTSAYVIVPELRIWRLVSAMQLLNKLITFACHSNSIALPNRAQITETFNSFVSGQQHFSLLQQATTHKSQCIAAVIVYGSAVYYMFLTSLRQIGQNTSREAHHIPLEATKMKQSRVICFTVCMNRDFVRNVNVHNSTYIVASI